MQTLSKTNSNNSSFIDTIPKIFIEPYFLGIKSLKKAFKVNSTNTNSKLNLRFLLNNLNHTNTVPTSLYQRITLVLVGILLLTPLINTICVVAYGCFNKTYVEHLEQLSVKPPVVSAFPLQTQILNKTDKKEPEIKKEELPKIDNKNLVSISQEPSTVLSIVTQLNAQKTKLIPSNQLLQEDKQIIVNHASPICEKLKSNTDKYKCKLDSVVLPNEVKVTTIKNEEPNILQGGIPCFESEDKVNEVASKNLDKTELPLLEFENKLEESLGENLQSSNESVESSSDIFLDASLHKIHAHLKNRVYEIAAVLIEYLSQNSEDGDLEEEIEEFLDNEIPQMINEIKIELLSYHPQENVKDPVEEVDVSISPANLMSEIVQVAKQNCEKNHLPIEKQISEIIKSTPLSVTRQPHYHYLLRKVEQDLMNDLRETIKELFIRICDNDKEQGLEFSDEKFLNYRVNKIIEKIQSDFSYNNFYEKNLKNAQSQLKRSTLQFLRDPVKILQRAVALSYTNNEPIIKNACEEIDSFKLRASKKAELKKRAFYALVLSKLDDSTLYQMRKICQRKISVMKELEKEIDFFVETPHAKNILKNKILKIYLKKFLDHFVAFLSKENLDIYSFVRKKLMNTLKKNIHSFDSELDLPTVEEKMLEIFIKTHLDHLISFLSKKQNNEIAEQTILSDFEWQAIRETLIRLLMIEFDVSFNLEENPLESSKFLMTYANLTTQAVTIYPIKLDLIVEKISSLKREIEKVDKNISFLKIPRREDNWESIHSQLIKAQKIRKDLVLQKEKLKELKKRALLKCEQAHTRVEYLGKILGS